MKYVGKAKNLMVLSKIEGIRVPKFIVVTPIDSDETSRELVDSFLKGSEGKMLAVRSSAAQEDSAQASFAGMYTTKLHVPATLEAVWEAVQAVRRSETEKDPVAAQYTQHHNLRDSGRSMDVIVQDMIDADTSGVIFSHDLNAADGYYTVSVSEGVGEHIVGGSTNGTLLRVARGTKPADMEPMWLGAVIDAMELIEAHYGSTSLDVEFAIAAGVLYILQCRPLTTSAAGQQADTEKLLSLIAYTMRTLEDEFQGDILGDMIDINPVELLGVSPTVLDVSVFGHLFGDRTVEKVRRTMGYDPLDRGLIKVVAGKPYTSLTVSAYSLRPQGIPRSIYDRIIGVYRNALIANPELQTQVEFSLYAMQTGKKLDQVMYDARLNEDERRITRAAFAEVEKTISQLSAELSRDFPAFAASYAAQTEALVGSTPEQILKHVVHGTEHFVALARLAFYWKNRFEETYPELDLNEHIAGRIHSPATDLQSALLAYHDGTLSREEVIERYGHLRPGQFSVLSEAYADDPDTYLFNTEVTVPKETVAPPDHPVQKTDVFRYVVSFMQAREEMKFLFSRSLHLFAQQLKELLANSGVSHEAAASLTWEQVQTQNFFSNEEAEEEQSLLLPEVLIPGITDLHVVTYAKAQPSYITHTTVKAEVCAIEREGLRANVHDKIVLLPNADPGYDFLFHSGARAIIAKVGGPASHMCIRATELQMPACIGCGEQLYQRLMQAQYAVLDCKAQQVIIPD